RGLLNACGQLELLPRISVNFHAYALTLNLVEKVRATPRLPGVRLGVEVLALGLRVDDPRICVDFYAYAWTSKAKLVATPRLDQGMPRRGLLMMKHA
ncbi:hypothetical protein PIB30_050871, partial [Stylosanthes scabra]|nr:hypothetical protein [Stylosanthes scabra]